MSNVLNNVKGYLNRKKREQYIEKLRRLLKVKEVSIISQNCIGGVFYHDMRMQFLSPTINLFFPAADYIKFVKNLKYYLSVEPVLHMKKNYPIGMLDDIEIHFMHYSSCEEAKEKWEIRKKRVILDKIIVVSTDRDGFTEELFEEWKAIPYKKILFTSNEKLSGYEGVVYFNEYNELDSVPDLIDNRKFYKDNAMLSLINNIED